MSLGRPLDFQPDKSISRYMESLLVVVVVVVVVVVEYKIRGFGWVFALLGGGRHDFGLQILARRNSSESAFLSFCPFGLVRLLVERVLVKAPC